MLRDATYVIRRALLLAITSLYFGCGFPEDASGPPPLEVAPGPPEEWNGTIGEQGGIGTTVTERHGGKYAFYVTGPTSGRVTSATQPAILSQFIRADDYRGKRIRLSAWVKPLDVSGAIYAGLWMRVDGATQMASFDNMSNRPVNGSGDWRQISVVLDVAPDAVGIALGILFSARNTLLIDDVSLEVVGKDVPSTNQITTPAPRDSATILSLYSVSGTLPMNLDFEGAPGPQQQTVDWVSRTALPLSTTDPNASLDDLEPLRQMVGSAHVVGLGEGTHGTREFFLMKHRILKFLVTRMGFTHFAIEATSPEADDMNRYVLTGDGDPVKLLSRLYFWTWNTQEVLDMVRWMREWNSTAPANQRVQFLGFDMQSPGASIDSVAAFVQRVDPGAVAEITADYLCLSDFRNRGPTPGRPTSAYASLSASARVDCAAAVKAVYDLLTTRRAQYEAASSTAVYQSVLHHARLVQQFEGMAASSQSRDASMAENVTWIRDQAGPNAKIVLWAHNGHINAVRNLMGGYLRTAYGSDYVNLGFAFGRGTFSAVGQSGNTFLSLGTFSSNIFPNASIEAIFGATDKPRLLFDARQIAGGGTAAAQLAAPIRMRSIGCCFDPSRESAYFSATRFPANFDLLVYFATGSASQRLPFNY
jgi:erythromycin esterase